MILCFYNLLTILPEETSTLLTDSETIGCHGGYSTDTVRRMVDSSARSGVGVHWIFVRHYYQAS